MTAADELLTAAILGLCAASIAQLLTPRLIASPPDWSFKTNVSGRRVPAVLGAALCVATLTAFVGLFIAERLGLDPPSSRGLNTALLFVTSVMFLAGLWDDRRGDERPRGFAGHLRAIRSGTVSGGVVKILGGVVAGAAAAYFVPERGAVQALQSIALVGLAANFINLTDRAPGRALKVTLLIAVPLFVLGSMGWVIPAAAPLGAVIVLLAPDLKERAMLGDAGANPLGAILGLGLLVSLDDTGRWIAIAILLALNLASERWSFSAGIAKVPPLRWLDRLGRLQEAARD